MLCTENVVGGGGETESFQNVGGGGPRGGGVRVHLEGGTKVPLPPPPPPYMEPCLGYGAVVSSEAGSIK